MYREHELGRIHQRVATHFAATYRPGETRFHSIISAAENPETGAIVVAGSIYGSAGFPSAKIGLLKSDGALDILYADDRNDTDPKWSPDGATLAFLSDRGQAEGNLQLQLADIADLHLPRATIVLENQAVESFQWSADGSKILLQTADAGADAAGSAARARIGTTGKDDRPSWMPTVTTPHHHGWRRAYIWDLAHGHLTAIGGDSQNVWEAAWCGAHEVVAILSASPSEGGWYETSIGVAPATGGAFSPLADIDLELGMVSASPDGRHIAIVEGRFHRGLPLGSLVIHDRQNGVRLEPEIGAQVSALEWRNDGTLFFAGFDAPGMLVGDFNLDSHTSNVIWRSEGAGGRKVPFARPVGTRGALVPAHAFDRYPCLLRIEQGEETVLLDLATPAITSLIEEMGPAEVVRWKGRDGLEIQGYLVMPKGVTNPPLVAFIHGGPSHLFRNAWTADNPIAALLVRFGYAVLFPNPRGSSGRGLAFAEGVIGDWGGEDCQDILAGIDHVIASYPVDGSRLFVTGGSYGGYMTSWLVTQTDRFSAACAIVPLTDMRSFFFTAHHPEFLAIYTRGGPYEVGGIFDQRSPLRHADKVTTPTLLIAGGMDNTTPATQASQFYRALALRGVPTELVVYPEEGHAVTGLEAQIDQGVRILEWFGAHTR